MQKKLHIGVTGGIGCGKSLVSAMMHEHFGFDILNADHLTEEAYCVVQPELVRTFGDGILDGRARVDKKRLSKLVFEDRARLSKLNAVMHPAMTVLVQNKLACAERPVLLEAALLFEAGWQNLVQKTIVVTAPAAVRIMRICQRDRVSPEYAAMRIAAQIPDSERLRKADIVIYNMTDVVALKRQCLRIFENQGV